jgi:hypothetical protein
VVFLRRGKELELKFHSRHRKGGGFLIPAWGKRPMRRTGKIGQLPNLPAGLRGVNLA